MKQLTVCIDDGLQWEVVYRAEISHTEEDYQELKSDLEFVREENKNLKLIQETNEKQIQNDIKERDELREENKTLKDKVNHLEFDVDAWYQLKLLLEWEIEKLKSDLMQDMKEITELEIENKNLNWRIANLKEEAEDRGKIIEYYKHDKKLTEKHIKKLKDRIKELFWKIYQLEEENENLRKDLFHLTNQKNNGKAK